MGAEPWASPEEAEAEGAQAWGRPGLHSEILSQERLLFSAEKNQEFKLS